MDDNSFSTFLGRHEFLLRRLHSLSGLVPVGAYMVIHLATNASVLSGPNVFQDNVDRIHALGPFLPIVEWTFIFIPLLYHSLYGVVIMLGWVPNNSEYPYVNNFRYTLQRVTGVIAFAFIGYHVWQMHYMGEPFGGGQFDPHHATSSAAAAIGGPSGESFWIPMIYAVGVLACVYHLANGIWTMGITWGVWISPAAQRKASLACGAFGVALAALGLAALSGITMEPDEIERARAIEERLNEQRIQLLGDAAESEQHMNSKAAATQNGSLDAPRAEGSSLRPNANTELQ